MMNNSNLILAMNHSPLDHRKSVRASERRSVGASERWGAAHNLRSTLSTLLTLHVLLATIAALCLVSCKKSDANAKPADVDYYTCTMHPSVKSKPNRQVPDLFNGSRAREEERSHSVERPKR